MFIPKAYRVMTYSLEDQLYFRLRALPNYRGQEDTSDYLPSRTCINLDGQLP